MAGSSAPSSPTDRHAKAPKSPLCQEFDEPDLRGWEFFVESRGVKIYRRLVKESGLYEYKVIGSFDDIPLEVFLNVYMDLEYRKKWDTYVKDLYTIQDADGGIYWEVKYPFPLSNRDYVYKRRQIEDEFKGQVAFAVEAESVEIPSAPVKSGVVRVVGYKQVLALTSNGASGTKFAMLYYDNPGGMIPTWLVNWAAKTGVPTFLENVNKACKAYASYQQKLRS